MGKRDEFEARYQDTVAPALSRYTDLTFTRGEEALGGGLPLGAALARRDIADAWEPGAHGSTFGGNPVACRAGLATLEIIESEGLVEHAREVGTFIKQTVEAARPRHPMISDVRGLGLMIGVDVVEPGDARPAASRIKTILKAAAREGVVLTKCGESSIRIAPPLSITREEAATGLTAILRALERVAAAASV